MSQIYFRKLHKTIGIVLVFFIILQAGSGLFLSFTVSHSHAHTEDVALPEKREGKPDLLFKEKAVEPGKYEAVVKSKEPVVHDHGKTAEEHQSMIQLIHHGGGFFGSIYRILLASGFLFMAFSGSLIFYLSRN